MNYMWTCPECKKSTFGETTGSYELGEEIECCWCGRVSEIIDIVHKFSVRMTGEKKKERGD